MVGWIQTCISSASLSALMGNYTGFSNLAGGFVRVREVLTPRAKLIH